MASMKEVFNKSPGAWSAGKPFDDGSGVYLEESTWTNPDTNTPINSGQSVFFARLGPGQVLGIGTGGIFTVDPPSP